ncbi:MAG TPA: host attachment protein [Sedimenticola sp.]|nr:host attachment protein [Sedimenticola sp.]
MSDIWVVVADSGRARIFTAEKPASPLQEVETLAHPEARLHEGDLVADKAGRDRNPGSTTHDMGGKFDAKHEELVRFAIQLSDDLEAARVAGRIAKLYIIAAPAFLGELRKRISPALQKLVADEISKDLTLQTPEEIRKQLPQYL